MVHGVIAIRIPSLHSFNPFIIDIRERKIYTLNWSISPSNVLSLNTVFSPTSRPSINYVIGFEYNGQLYVVDLLTVFSENTSEYMVKLHEFYKNYGLLPAVLYPNHFSSLSNPFPYPPIYLVLNPVDYVPFERGYYTVIPQNKNPFFPLISYILNYRLDSQYNITVHEYDGFNNIVINAKNESSEEKEANEVMV